MFQKELSGKMMHYSNTSEPNGCDYSYCHCCHRRACINRCAGFADDNYYDRYFRYTYQYSEPGMFVTSPFDINPRLPDDFTFPMNPAELAVPPDEEYAKKNTFDIGF